MSNSSEEFVGRSADAVEALLEKAEPRPLPPSEDEQLVRQAVYAEWKAVTGKHRSRQRVTRFAIAATVLLAVAISFNAFRIVGVAPVEVALISKDHGSIYLLGEQSELREMQNLMTVFAGQTIETGKDSGIGLAWHDGGSLRLDENTRVEFKSPNSVYLVSGRIYFDSQITAAISGGGITKPDLVIETDYGSVTHLGTQYMTEVDSGTLIVSVREGQVDVDGRHTAYEGQEMQLLGGAQPSVANISRTSGKWAWVEATAPTLDFSGKSTHDFLQWVGRETGHDVVFDSPEAEQVARAGGLIGTIEGLDPRAELEFRMRGEDLIVIFDSEGGSIKVSAIDTGSSP
jgi:hypothetical protein